MMGCRDGPPCVRAQFHVEPEPLHEMVQPPPPPPATTLPEF